MNYPPVHHLLHKLVNNIPFLQKISIRSDVHRAFSFLYKDPMIEHTSTRRYPQDLQKSLHTSGSKTLTLDNSPSDHVSPWLKQETSITCNKQTSAAVTNNFLVGCPSTIFNLLSGIPYINNFSLSITNSITRFLKSQLIRPKVLNHWTPKTISQLPNVIKRASIVKFFRSKVHWNSIYIWVQAMWFPSATATATPWRSIILKEHPNFLAT